MTDESGRVLTHDPRDLICSAWVQGEPSDLDARCPICRAASGRVQAAGMNDDESVDEWWQRLLDTLDKCLGLTTGPNVPHRFCCWHDVRGTDVCCMCQVNPCEEANRDVR